MNPEMIILAALYLSLGWGIRSNFGHETGVITFNGIICTVLASIGILRITTLEPVSVSYKERALERHDNKDATVIPVIIRDVSWHSAPFGRLQALPKEGKAVATWGPDKNARDTAWRNVSEGIEKVIKEMRSRI